MKLKGIEIKPGMVIITKSSKYVAFPTKRSDCPMAFVNTIAGGWVCAVPETLVVEIRDLFTEESLNSGELLWPQERDREITMDEIAEKFGIPVKYLRIKKE